MTDLDLVDWPLEEWAYSRALFPTRLIQERCGRKKRGPMTVLVDRPLEEWAFSRALFPIRLIQKRCARKKKKVQLCKGGKSELACATLERKHQELLAQSVPQVAKIECLSMTEK